MAQTAAFIRNPSVTLNVVSRDQTLGPEKHRVLAVGQMISGSASAGFNADIPRTPAEINAMFGARSHLAQMLRRFREVNPYTPVDVIALEDADGTAATSKIVFLADATAAGRLTIAVGSEEFEFSVDVAVGDDEAAIMTKILAKTALATSAPWTAAKSTTTNTDDTVTFTAANDGTHANAWMIRITGTVPGVSYTVTGWASGATDPSLTGVFDPVANIRYQGIIWPQAYATATLKSFLDARRNVDNDIKDGVGFQYYAGNFAGAKSLANTTNSPGVVILTNEANASATWKGPHLPELPDVITAEFVASRALRFEDGISISRIVVNNDRRDQFGGTHTASLPYFNTPFNFVGQPAKGTGYTFAEQRELEQAGVTVLGSNDDFNAVIMGDVVTTYLNDAAGNADDTWHYLNWWDTHSTIREYYVVNMRKRFRQHRMSIGRPVPGFAVLTRELVEAYGLELYDGLADLMLTVKSPDARRFFEQNQEVILQPELRRVQYNAVTPMVSQFGEMIGTIKFAFSLQ